ncbi:MAG: hypothetical protein ACXVCV_14445, partial [Polyangia bacterium]
MRLAIAALALIPTVALAQPTAPSASPAQTPAPPAKLDKPPKLLRFIEAEPPPALAERGSVDVILTIDIDESGKVVRVDVAKSGGADVDDAAV